MTHWLTRYDPDDGEPYGEVCDCPIGADHESDGQLSDDPFGDGPEELADSPATPRVFLDGDEVPAGVCVLDEWGEVRYLDATGDCRCDDDVDVCECSFSVLNGSLGPLVEVFLPQFGVLVAEEIARRKNSGGVS